MGSRIELRRFAPLPDEHRLEKNVNDAFANSGLERWLRVHDISRLVVAGVSTNNSVEATGRAVGIPGPFDRRIGKCRKQLLHRTTLVQSYAQFCATHGIQMPGAAGESDIKGDARLAA